MLSLVGKGAKVLRGRLSSFWSRTGWVFLIAGLFATSCGFGGNSFEQWEAAEGEYFNSLGDYRNSFPDDGHALAFALASDCFVEIPAASELETAVQDACVTLEGVLSDLATMRELCDWLTKEENVAAEVNARRLCG